MSIRVFLVDEQPVLRLGIRTILDRASDIQIVGEAINAADIQRRILAAQPNVIILAHILSNVSSSSVAEIIVQLDQALQVLAYGRISEDQDVKAMLAAGALGYALTTDDPNDLIMAVRSLAANHIWLSPQITEQTFARIDRELKSAPSLTIREQQILRLIGEGLKNREIAEALDLQWQTVKNYIYRIYQKLGVDSRSQAMLRAIRLGLVQVEMGDR